MTSVPHDMTSVFYNCQTCGALVWSKERHKCPPAWEVVCDEHDPEHVVEVFACDAEAAVEKWAQRYDVDSADYPIASGGGDVEEVVRVRRVDPVPRKGGTNWEHFTVTGEFEAVYQARPVKGGQ